MPKQPQQVQTAPKPPEKTAAQKFWENAAREGFFNFHAVYNSQDLNNPTEGIITIGWKDMNGLPIPAISAPKEKWIALAKLIISKYGEV